MGKYRWGWMTPSENTIFHLLPSPVLRRLLGCKIDHVLCTIIYSIFNQGKRNVKCRKEKPFCAMC